MFFVLQALVGFRFLVFFSPFQIKVFVSIPSVVQDIRFEDLFYSGPRNHFVKSDFQGSGLSFIFKLKFWFFSFIRAFVHFKLFEQSLERVSPDTAAFD